MFFKLRLNAVSQLSLNDLPIINYLVISQLSDIFVQDGHFQTQCHRLGSTINPTQWEMTVPCVLPAMFVWCAGNPLMSPGLSMSATHLPVHL